ncbi:MAG: glycoside hydrolase family 99-like domain-containing protein [Opitutaceae bacterium]|nr:glycoside hydrolase family 99-like domain-containing protein [Opitutaceae bacterium]
MNDPTDPRLIAFYLPQFHPIPENDLWWGRGFTEWSNLTRSRPLFPGHVQPRLPADLGFYDLRLSEVREAQAELARRAGISAFCYYHYWFGGRRLLERPLDEVVASGCPDFPFCVCWANESWTRRWDGLEREVLMAQEYAGVEPESFIRDLLPALRDPRYVRVNGKALLLVYRPESIPEARRWTDAWREFARANGVGELLLCRVHSFSQEAPEVLGFDAAVEFPPLGGLLERSLLAPTEVTALVGSGANFQGMLADYPRFARMAAEAPPPPFRRFRGVAPSWDNTPRRRNRALVFTGANPDDYERWLSAALQHTVREQPAGERLVFVNAWNEWAEGCHLEPDVVWGDRYLRATRAAIASARHLGEHLAGDGSVGELVELLATRERSIRALSAEVQAREDTVRDLRRQLAAADLAARSASTASAADAAHPEAGRLRVSTSALVGGRRPTAVIFGAGKGGERVFRMLRDSWEVVAFIDNDTGKHGSLIEGVRVVSPALVQENKDAVVFLASMYADELQAQLLAMGVARSRIRHVDTQILIGAAVTAPDSNRKLDVILFGTGNGGRRAFDNLPSECRVVAFADNDPAKIGQSFCGYPVINPAELLERAYDHVIIASMYADEIIAQLEELGVARHKIEVAHPSVLTAESGPGATTAAAPVKTPVVVFGASMGGRRAMGVLPEDWTVVAFADNDPAKIGGSLCGVPVIAPDAIRKWAAAEIVVATMHVEQVLAQLKGLGLPEERIWLVHADALAGRLLLASGARGSASVQPPAECGEYPRSWPALQPYILQYASELRVSGEVHHADHIFRFIVDHPDHANKPRDAVRYYFHDGAGSADKLAGLLFDDLKLPRARGTSLLEFASGYGCLTRHLVNRLAPVRVVSCDIHNEAVAFLRDVLGVEVQQSASLPEELQLPCAFDAVFALSFFSHMPERTWARWLGRLYAALKPGGYLLFTTMGTSSRKFVGDPQIPPSGIWFHPASEQKDLDTAEYGTTLVTAEFVRKQVSRLNEATLIDERMAYWWGHQDLYVVRRTQA